MIDRKDFNNSIKFLLEIYGFSQKHYDIYKNFKDKYPESSFGPAVDPFY